MIREAWTVTKEQIADYMKYEAEIIFDSLIKSINTNMLHNHSLSAAEAATFSGFLLLKDEGLFKDGEYVVVSVRNETEVDLDEGKTETKVSVIQKWYNIISVLTAKNTKGVKRGFAMVKIKLTKNPIPKVETSTDQEAEGTDDIAG